MNMLLVNKSNPLDQLLVCERTKMEHTPLSQELINQTKAHLERGKRPLETMKKIVCYNKR